MGSTVLRPATSDPAAHTLALSLGLALHQTVKSALNATATTFTLKWPNDLLVGKAKLAGILLEREGEAIVAGVGVNLASAPVIEGRETVALAEFGGAPDRDDFACRLAAQLASELARWRSEGLASTIERWLARAHGIGTPLRVHPPGEEPMSGEFAGLAEEGALRLRLDGGAETVVHAGDVMLIGERG